MLTAAIGVTCLAFAAALTFALVAHAARARDTADARLAAARATPAVHVPVAAKVAPTAVETATPAPSPAAEQKPAGAPRRKVAVAKPVKRAAAKPAAKKAVVAPSVERVRIDVGTVGFEPSSVTVAAGSKVTITVGKGEGCAAGFLMPGLGIAKDNSAGPVTFTIGPLEAGTYRFTCGMEMVEGRLVAR